MLDERSKKIVVFVFAVVLLFGFYIFTKNVSPDSLKDLGVSLPLPLFTFLIALVDGFNPCNLFVLTLLMSLMLSESHSRKRIYAVGFSFVAVVFLFYLMFMSAWLNILKYVGFIDPLRIAIGLLAVGAGLINCKEFFFYRKGVTLMVQNRYVNPLKKRVHHVAELMKSGSMSTLIGASVMLAVFASLVELPCTAGFPIIYAGILSGYFLESTVMYYMYLVMYNLVYVTPLAVIVGVLGYMFHGKQISTETMGVIKFIGGAIMLMLGIVLLVNPGLVMMG